MLNVVVVVGRMVYGCPSGWMEVCDVSVAKIDEGCTGIAYSACAP